MLIGVLVNNMAVLNDDASVMTTSYVPMPANPNFYLGLILFAVGALLGCFIFLGTLVIAKEEKTYEGSNPLVTFGALTACIIAVFTIASGAIILIPTYLWSLGYVNHIDAAVYRLVRWALGHSSQQINVAAHVAVWYAIAAIVFGARPLSEKVSRTAFFLYIAFLQIASAHHLLVDPAPRNGANTTMAVPLHASQNEVRSHSGRSRLVLRLQSAADTASSQIRTDRLTCTTSAT